MKREEKERRRERREGGRRERRFDGEGEEEDRPVIYGGVHSFYLNFTRHSLEQVFLFFFFFCRFKNYFRERRERERREERDFSKKKNGLLIINY